MRRGKQTLIIDQADFILGATTQDSAQDGGFSNLSTNVNPFIKRGTIYGTESGTNISTTVTGTLIATADDANGGNDKYFVGDDGKFYTLDNDGSTFTLRQTDATNTYQIGTTDAVQYFLSLFVSSTDDVVKLDGSNLTSSTDFAWWSTLDASLNTGVRHPLLVFEDTLHIGNKNTVHTWDGSTASPDVLVLSVENNITAMAADSSTGLMLIATTFGPNYAGTEGQESKMYVWDGFSTKPNRVFAIDDMVTAMRNMGGITYVWTINSFGYWNGTGITPIAPLNVTLSGDKLVYKHKTADSDNKIFYAEEQQIWAFGSVYGNNSPARFPIINRADQIDTIAYLGSNKLGVANTGASTTTLKSIDYTVAGSSPTFKSRRYFFPHKVALRTLTASFEDDVGAGATPMGVVLYDEQNDGVSAGIMINNDSGDKRVLDLTLNNRRFDSFQIETSTSIGADGINKLTITYDPVE